jgi:hypothetical protein
MKIYMSKMTLNYHMIVERYPKPNGVVGSLIPDREFISLLDGKKLARLPRASCVQKKRF